MASVDSIRRNVRSLTEAEGRRYTHDDLPTGAITSSEAITAIMDHRPEGLCRVLDGMLKKDLLGDFLRKHEINADTVRRLVKILCDQRHTANLR